MAVKNIVIIYGESTLDNRIIGTPRAPYNSAFTNCQYWNGTNHTTNFTPKGDLIWGDVNGYTYDVYLMKKIADTVGKNIIFLKKAKGGATVSAVRDALKGCFNATLYNDHFSVLKNYILNVRKAIINTGDTPVFKLVISDIKGNDAYYNDSSAYCNYTNSKLQGCFVDLNNMIRSITETPNLPVIHSQLLFKQTSLGTEQQRNDMLAAQEAFQTYYPNAYFLRMNEIDINAGGTRYTMQPDQHLDDNGDWNKSEDMITLLNNNSLLSNW